MNSVQPFGAPDRLRSNAEDLRRILAISHIGGGEVPIERHNSAGPKRLLKPALPLQDRCLMPSSLGKQGRQDECAERRGQNCRLSRKDALLDRQTRVAKNADGKWCRQNDGDGPDKRRRGGKDRRQARSYPDAQGTERGDGKLESPRLVWQEDKARAYRGHHRKRQCGFSQFTSCRRTAYQ